MMKLTTDRQEALAVTRFEQVHAALNQLGADGFAILERPSGHFLQAAVDNGGFKLEKQDGDVHRHFSASVGGRAFLSAPEVEAMFRAFFENRPFPADVTWHPMVVKGHSRAMVMALRALPFVALVVLVALYARDLMTLLQR